MATNDNSMRNSSSWYPAVASIICRVIFHIMALSPLVCTPPSLSCLHHRTHSKESFSGPKTLGDGSLHQTSAPALTSQAIFLALHQRHRLSHFTCASTHVDEIRLPPHSKGTKNMAPDPIGVQALSQQYHESDDEGREQLFQDRYTSHYKGPRTAPDDLANTLKPLLLSLSTYFQGHQTPRPCILSSARNSALECNGSVFPRLPGPIMHGTTRRVLSLSWAKYPLNQDNSTRTLSSSLSSSIGLPNFLMTITATWTTSPAAPCETTTLLSYP